MLWRATSKAAYASDHPGVHAPRCVNGDRCDVRFPGTATLGYSGGAGKEGTRRAVGWIGPQLSRNMYLGRSAADNLTAGAPGRGRCVSWAPRVGRPRSAWSRRRRGTSDTTADGELQPDPGLPDL